METYLDREGKLLPKFYQDPKWKVMESILLTVFDCTCCIATWGFAIYLMFLKSIFIVGCSLLFLCTDKVDDRSKENLEKEGRIVRDPAEAHQISGWRPFQFPPLEEHLQKSRPSNSKASPAASKLEKSTQAITPEIERSLEAEKVHKISDARSEASSNTTNEFQDPEESP